MLFLFVWIFLDYPFQDENGETNYHFPFFLTRSLFSKLSEINRWYTDPKLMLA